MLSEYVCGECGAKRLMPDGQTIFQCLKCMTICVVDREAFLAEDHSGEEDTSA